MDLPSRTRRPESFRIIDADTHLSEPMDLWTKRAPPSLKDRVPQVKSLGDGKIAWVIDGDKSIGDGAPANSTIYKDGTKARNLDFQKLGYDDVHPASYDGKARVALLDEIGVWAQIIYPNIMGFGGHKAAMVDAELRLATVKIFNDGMAELQAESGDRLCPMAMLPWWDVKEAVRETERAIGLGLKGVNINSDPQSSRLAEIEGLPDLGDPHWDPLWEICQDKNVPVNFHIGASEQAMDFIGHQGWPSLPHKLQMGLAGAMVFFNNGRTLGNLIYSGVLDRYPGLQFVSVESGIGWIPFLLEALDNQYTEMTHRDRLQLMPSEYFQRNFYGCFWFEREDIAHVVRRVGVDRVMFETDFPHPTCLYPIDNLREALPDLTDEEWGKVMGQNAARLYNIPLG
jgi:predicted TIM-barrel fold metal-dependent hydrolase